MLSSANAYVQSTTEPEFRGRVMGVYMLVFIGGTPVGSLVVGLLLQLSTLFIPPELKNVGALLVLIIILLIRPYGLLGRSERVG